MEIYPAIDLRGGRVVRLTRGDYDEMTVYSDSPAEVAAEFVRAGTQWLHVVDLDGALQGETPGFDTIAQILDAVDCSIQVGGGVRDCERIERYLSIGVNRVILGTAAVREPKFLEEALSLYGERVAVGVDAKDGFVSVHGWQTVTEIVGLDFCYKLRDLGVKTVIYTDISRDGMMSGPNHEIYSELAKIDGLDIIASGGVTSVSDVVRLAGSGIHGAIIGKALYEGGITISEAREAAR